MNKYIIPFISNFSSPKKITYRNGCNLFDRHRNCCNLKKQKELGASYIPLFIKDYGKELHYYMFKCGQQKRHLCK